METTIPAPRKMTPITGGVEAGVRWAIVRAPLFGAINGYVRLPEGHVWQSLSLQSEDYERVEVHGGITFGPESDGWIGFDTLHAGDNWPGVDYHFCAPAECDCINWTEEMVIAEAKDLARQVAAADPTLATEVSA